MKQLTRQEVEAVVERLADKTLSFGCMIVDKNHSPSKIMFVENGIGQTYSGIQIGAENTYNFFNGYMTPEMKVLGHPITIGTVLEKIREKEGYVFTHKIYSDLLIYWQPLGLSRSLQQIIEASGWERVRLYPLLLSTTFEGEPVTKAPSIATQDVEVLKSPETNALFSFLQEISL